MAWPVVYWVMDQWLAGFPYRAEISSWPFAAGALVMLVLGLSTAAYRPERFG